MTNILELAFKVSRVRFWLYLGGTYLVGYIIGIADVWALLDPFFLVQAFFFMIPANIFLYGINDISDKDTDMFNPKKDEKEYRAAERDRKQLYALVGLSFIYALILILFQPDFIAQLLFLSWMILSVTYSVKPFRFKALPILDFASNFLYVIPALLAYYQVTQIIPPWTPVLAAFLWVAAMQLFSAIPDIEADRQANIKTTAVVVGERISLILCLFFWAGFAVILIWITPFLYLPWSLMMLVYPGIPLFLLLRTKTSIERAYWYFPYYTGLFGMVIFFVVGLPLIL
ncbi:MAG: prenyltransferase [Candidatus Thorarchaeota archaeon]